MIKHLLNYPVLILPLLLISFCTTLLAETIQIETIIVTSTKTEKTQKENTTNTTILTKADIEKFQADDIIDILRHIPGMTLNNMNTGSTYIGFRGAAPAPKGTMIMLDGIEMNTAANYVLAQNIPIADIERIEVIKNPSSALYGPAGVGGIINIITQKPQKPLESQVRVSYGSFSRKEANFVCKGLLNSGFFYGLSGTAVDTNGYRDESNTSYQIMSPRLGYETDQLYLEFIGVMNPSRGNQPGGLPLDQYQQFPEKATSPDSTGKGFATTWGAKMDFFINPTSLLRLKSSYRTDDWHAEMDGNYLEGDHQRHLTSEINYLQSHTLGQFNNTLLTGIEYRNYQSTYRMHPDDFWTDKTWWWESKNDVQENILGYFVQYDTRFAEKLSINMGIRFDQIQMKYSDQMNLLNNVETTHRKISPKIGFSVSPFQSFDFFGNYSHGIRSLNLVETVWTPKEHLKPEKLYHYELGLRGLFTNNIHFNMACFMTKTKDFIIETGTGQSLNWENAGEVSSKGVEFFISKISHEGSSCQLNYTFQQSDYKNYHTLSEDFSNKTVPLVPKHMIGATISLNMSPFGKIDTAIRFIDDKFIDHANTLILNKYTTVDIKYSYNYQLIDITLSVTNLFDHTYAEYGKMNGGAYVNGVPVAYPGDGRSITGSIAWKF